MLILRNTEKYTILNVQLSVFSENEHIRYVVSTQIKKSNTTSTLEDSLAYLSNHFLSLKVTTVLICLFFSFM